MSSQLRARWLLAVSALLVLPLCACALVLGIDPPNFVEADATDEGGSDSNPEAGSPDGAIGDGSPGQDAADAADADLRCRGEERPSAPTSAVFVFEGGTDGLSCGTESAPCKTITFGLDRAKDTGRARVLVARGVYSESIALEPGIEIEGGWEVFDNQLQGKEFFRSCTTPLSSVVVINGVTERTLTAIDLGGAAKVRLITLGSKNPVNAGESVYGLFARGATTQVTLEDVDIVVAPGGDGASGSAGAAGAQGDSGCAPGTGASATQSGANGSGADGGNFTANGFVAAPAIGGDAGFAGSNGTRTDGGCVACVTCSGVISLCNTAAAAPSCGQPGVAGCAGQGGQGGTPGSSGGASFGIYAWNAVVNVSGGRVIAGSGGAGGAGGGPGAAGPGGTGSMGGAGPVCLSSCSGLGCQSGPTNSGAAGSGGNGGNGTAGGTGGGGAGGHSIAIFAGADAGISLADASVLAGDAGLSLGNGATGMAKDRHP